MNNLGFCIVTSNKQLAQKLLQILAHYHPHQSQKLLLNIKTKYYEKSPNINILTWQEILNKKQQKQEIDCLLILSDTTNQQIQEQNIIVQHLDSIVETFNPNTYAIFFNSSDQQVKTDKILDQIQSYIEVIIDDIHNLHQLEQKPKMPKSLLEQANGITRLVLLLQSTIWKGMKMKNQKSINQKVQKFQKVQQTQNKQVVFSGQPAQQIKIKKEETNQKQSQQKFQSQMQNFANLMNQMCSMKNSQLSDEQRKKKAQMLVMQLMQNFDDGEEQFDQDY